MSKNHFPLKAMTGQVMVGLTIMFAAGPAAAESSKDTMIKEALMAAPPSLAAVATVQDWEGNVLREGKGGFVCLPRTPGSKVVDAMCLDEPWLAWANAWVNKKPVKVDRVGMAYMLAEDGGASNIDPYAEGPTADNQWVVEGKHLMIIVPDPVSLNGLSTDPNSGGPYVMWKGTPYAHIMAPLD